MAAEGAAGSDGAQPTPPLDWQVQVEEVQKSLQSSQNTNRDLKFADEACIRRYVQAQRGDTKKALKGIVSTAEWRIETIPKPLGCSVCKADSSIHCFELIGHDQYDRPVIYGCPARATKASPRLLLK